MMLFDRFRLAQLPPTGEMARDLDVTVATIEKHLDAAYPKLQVHSRVEAVVVAIWDGQASIDGAHH
jgi:DNA-binding CsgD family transcriptional regulator